MPVDFRDLVIAQLADDEAALFERVATLEAQLATVQLVLGEALTLLHLAAVEPKQFKHRIAQAREDMLAAARRLVAEMVAQRDEGACVER